MINYLTGDATNPIKKPAIIAHVCNDIGAWGAGFVLAVSAKWKDPERQYKEWCHKKWPTFGLGCVQFIPVEVDSIGVTTITIANMIGQRGIKRKRGDIPLRYDALKQALKDVYYNAQTKGCTVHMPRIGCGLAGGDWSEVEKIIEEVMTVETYVYDFPVQSAVSFVGPTTISTPPVVDPNDPDPITEI